MSAYYYFYSPKTGEKIDEGKYVGLPFLWNSEFTDATSLIHSCAVKKTSLMNVYLNGQLINNQNYGEIIVITMIQFIALKRRY